MQTAIQLLTEIVSFPDKTISITVVKLVLAILKRKVK